jgi:hypothetical protein
VSVGCPYVAATTGLSAPTSSRGMRNAGCWISWRNHPRSRYPEQARSDVERRPPHLRLYRSHRSLSVRAGVGAMVKFWAAITVDAALLVLGYGMVLGFWLTGVAR